MVAWNETVFSKMGPKVGQFLAAIILKRQSDDFEVVIISVYGLTKATRRNELWVELAAVASAFQGPQC